MESYLSAKAILSQNIREFGPAAWIRAKQIFRSLGSIVAYELVGDCIVALFLRCGIPSQTTFATRKSISKFDSERSLSPNICSCGQAGSDKKRESSLVDVFKSVDAWMFVESISSIRLSRAC